MKDTDKGYQEPILGGDNSQTFADEGEGEGNNKETNTGNEDQGNEKDDKTFTQEDVNNIVAKESRKAQEKLFKDLGIEDFEGAKEGMKKFHEWQESQKTEAEKKDEKLTNLEKEHLSIKSENELLKAQISASKQGVAPESIEDVVVLAKSLVSEDLDMDGAIKAVVEKYPHFAVAQEVEEDDKIPRFSTGEHTKKREGLSDPFQDKINKYKK